MTTRGAAGISFFVGSYSDDDNDPSTDNQKAIQQTTLVAEYASSVVFNGKTYYFTFDREDIGATPPAAAHLQGRRPGGIAHVLGENTAKPCPPNVCTGLSSLP
jgi:hypothetical protein